MALFRLFYKFTNRVNLQIIGKSKASVFGEKLIKREVKSV